MLPIITVTTVITVICVRNHFYEILFCVLKPKWKQYPIQKKNSTKDLFHLMFKSFMWTSNKGDDFYYFCQKLFWVDLCLHFSFNQSINKSQQFIRKISPFLEHDAFYYAQGRMTLW